MINEFRRSHAWQEEKKKKASQLARHRDMPGKAYTLRRASLIHAAKNIELLKKGGKTIQNKPLEQIVEEHMDKKEFLLYKKRLVEILASYKEVPNTKVFDIPGLDERINSEVGRFLPDSVLLQDLVVKPTGSYNEFGDFTGTYTINTKLSTGFVKTLNPFKYRTNIRTIGEIRKEAILELISIANITENRAKFLKKIFDRLIYP